MKLTINRQALEKKLNSATALIGTKSLIPILDYGLIKVTDKKMIIVTSDSNVTFKSFLNYEESVGELFDFVCDINIILRTISILKSEFITLDVDDKNVILSTPKTRKRYQIPIIQSASEFPIIDDQDFKNPIIVNGNLVSDMIKKSGMIVNQNDLRIGMQGINIKVKDSILSVQSTNGTVGVNLELNLEINKLSDDFGPILVPKAISKVIHNYSRSPELEISVSQDNRNIKLYDGSTTSYIRLLDGTFPNIEMLLKNHQPDIYTVLNREDLILAIKRNSIYTNKVSRTIILDGIGDNIVIKGEDIDFNKNSNELIESSFKSKEMSFVSAFNYDFLSLIYNNLNGEDVIFSQTSPKGLAFFTDNSDLIYKSKWLVAPIIIQNKN